VEGTCSGPQTWSPEAESFSKKYAQNLVKSDEEFGILQISTDSEKISS